MRKRSKSPPGREIGCGLLPPAGHAAGTRPRLPPGAHEAVVVADAPSRPRGRPAVPGRLPHLPGQRQLPGLGEQEEQGDERGDEVVQRGPEDAVAAVAVHRLSPSRRTVARGPGRPSRCGHQR